MPHTGSWMITLKSKIATADAKIEQRLAIMDGSRGLLIPNTDCFFNLRIEQSGLLLELKVARIRSLVRHRRANLTDFL